MNSQTSGQNRRMFLKNLAWSASAVAAGANTMFAAQDPDTVAAWSFDPKRNIILPPEDQTAWDAFRQQLTDWRRQARKDLSYSDAQYRHSEFAWVKSCYCCCFLMLCDQTFFDYRTGRWTVKEFVQEGREQFGGFDAAVLWHAYPRIGLDNRNQFDFYRDMPGGLRGLRKVTLELQSLGVRVFINYNPWDTGTRRESKDDVGSLADLVAAIDADGIFLDTMDQGAAEFRSKLDAMRRGVALESEIALPLARVHDHHLSWAQWFEDSEAPGVLRNKFFERCHMQHQIKRWDYDHTGELHSAWMNGSGMMVWENVFGSWIGWSERDKSILRSMLPIQRKFANLFSGERWTPLVPTLALHVYASLWEEHGIRLWTLINRSEREVSGDLLQIEVSGEERVYDLVAGDEIASDSGNFVRTSGRLNPRGIGCILATSPNALERHSLGDWTDFLSNQKQTRSRSVWDKTNPRRQTRLLIASRSLASHGPKNMVTIPGAKLNLEIEMRDRECGYYESTPPEGHQLASSYNFRVSRFERRVELPSFRMDLTPVTNREFDQFLESSGYRPRRAENFLKHWGGNHPPPARADHPVVYVDLEDARAYARWCGKQLPSEEQWQYAAAGPAALRYPWGDEMEPGRCNDGQTGVTTPVLHFPTGRSPFGVYDLCGNVWEITESERTDGRTRFCILRGGPILRLRARGGTWTAGHGQIVSLRKCC